MTNLRPSVLAAQRRCEEARKLNVKKRVAKRKKKAEAKESEPERKLPTFDLRSPSDGQTGKAVLNSKTVEGWFNAALLKRQGDDEYIPVKWGRREQGMANTLLKEYGDELLHRAIDLFVAKWGEIVDYSHGRLSGEPTINLLYSKRMRAQIFGELQGNAKGRSRKRAQVGEHHGPRDKGRGIGW